MFGILPPPYQPPALDREMLSSSLLREASLCSESRAPQLLGAESTWQLSTQPQIGYQSICLKLGRNVGWGNVRIGRKGEGLQSTVFRACQSHWKHQLTAAVNGCLGTDRRLGLSTDSHRFYGAHVPLSLCCTMSYWWILEVREPVVFSCVASRFNPVVTQRSWFQSVGHKREERRWGPCWSDVYVPWVPEKRVCSALVEWTVL